MNTKEKMIKEIELQLHEADSGTVGVLYRIICKREKAEVWKRNILAGLRRQSRGQILSG